MDNSTSKKAIATVAGTPTSPPTEPESEAAPKPPTKAQKSDDKTRDPEELIKPLKELIAALERRQKVTQEIGDYRTVLQSLISGELMSGEDLERAKQVIQGLGKLIKATVDHQSALSAAEEVMPALDQILGVEKKT